MTAAEAWAKHRKNIETALSKAGDTHNSKDVLDGIMSGLYQFWPGETACLVTQVIDFPNERHLHIFVAAGDLNEIRDMYPYVEGWAKENGCVKATLMGRKGWSRSFLSQMKGWKQDMIHMSVELQ